MHWGTFILTDEPVVEPPLRLVKEAARAGLEEDEFVVVKIGETLVV
jgi:N-acyl-phosphatidylethanolamine-hydrolysing phospholipase D